MSDLIVVNGEECLNYIDKDVGFANRYNSTKDIYDDNYEMSQNPTGSLANTYKTYKYMLFGMNIWKWSQNKNKRVVGHVVERLDDGGLVIDVYGSDTINNGNNGNCVGKRTSYKIDTQHFYECVEIKDPFEDSLFDCNMQSYPAYPNYVKNAYISPQDNFSTCACAVFDTYHGFDSGHYPFDMLLDFIPEFDEWGTMSDTEGCFLDKDGNPSNSFNLSEGKMQFGRNITRIPNYDPPAQFFEDLCDNPLYGCLGNVYGFLTYICRTMAPIFYGDGTTGQIISTTPLYANNRGVYNYNNMCLIYNMVLTENLNFALNYLENGTLPPDAFLYPLDWENLPRYDDIVPTGDEPEDYPDDNDPDDDLRDFDPTPNETPTYTVNQLTNYNWYWLTVPQWAEFINWFWNDIGDFSDFDDIIAKVKGLYNDVASAVIMCRYYPVDISWIGGLGTQSNIKLGMIEKAGSYDTISQANALRSVDIGHVHIGQKYKSFMDMSPYSQLSLYLPWHGFIDLDMNLFNGHDVYVKALYDYLSGTIQYYIFYDNEVLVNTILCKMAMDIPITLQTKNDRDSAIFNNVSSTIGGLVGAGAGILSGNPIGMTLGITQGVGAFNSANASAPMRLMGNVGESGAYIGCQNCFVVVRRPTIQPSDGNAQTSTKGLTTWKRNVGMLCGYGYTLSDLSGQGFTVCHSPRIDFTSSAPLQSEVDEIYNYLEKGVIL